MILLSVALILSLLSPEVEGCVVRVNRRGRGGGSVGGYKRNGKRQGGRRIPVQKRKGRTGVAPPDADVVTDETSGNNDGAVGDVGALGDLAGICEILMFDKGEGSYSLKFIKNC